MSGTITVALHVHERTVTAPDGPATVHATGHTTPLLDRCRCGVTRRAYLHTNLEGLVSESHDLWSDGQP